jgi:hypothetical protein
MASKAKAYGARGKRRYRTDYRDDQGVKRTRGGFRRAKDCNDWGDLLERTRALGLARPFLDLGDDWGQLRSASSNDELRFLLDRGPEDTLHALMVDWLRMDGPNLAAATFNNYLGVYNRHIRPYAGGNPAREYEKPAAVNRLLSDLTAAGVGKPTRDMARAALSSSLSWAVDQGRLATNGALEVRRNRRRSGRVSVRAQSSASWEQRSESRRAWAIEPGAYWALHRGARRQKAQKLPMHRMAMQITLEYGLGLRPQEALGATFRQFSKGRFRMTQVLTQTHVRRGDKLAKELSVIEAAKTAAGVDSRRCPEWVEREVAAWRKLLADLGMPHGLDDFVLPGTHPDGHYSWAQYQNLTRDLRRCTRQLEPEFAYLAKVTHYSLRRGHISLRILAREDIKRVAEECGTSTKVIHEHYLHELDVRDEMPPDFTFDSAVLAARTRPVELRAVS